MLGRCVMWGSRFPLPLFPEQRARHRHKHLLLRLLQRNTAGEEEHYDPPSVPRAFIRAAPSVDRIFMSPTLPSSFPLTRKCSFPLRSSKQCLRRTACIKNPSCIRPTEVHEACIHIEKRGKRVTWLPFLPDDPMQLLSRRGRPPSAAEAVLLFN